MFVIVTKPIATPIETKGGNSLPVNHLILVLKSGKLSDV